jgi:hypothetical protein
MEFESRLWSPDQTVFGCLFNHKAGSRANYFVRLCLTVNTKQQNENRINNQRRLYFGELIAYLRYRLPDCSHRLLACVKIYSVKTIPDSPWPYKTPSASYKLKIVNVDEIIDLCARDIDIADREYISWPYKVKYDLSIGDFNLL